MLVLVIVCLLMSSGYANYDGMGSDTPPESGRIIVRSVELSDHDAVLEWARGICRGVSVEEIADTSSIEPTTDAAVQALVGNLPDGASDQTRKEAARVCAIELEAFGQRRRMIMEVLAAEVKVASTELSSTELTRTYGAMAGDIQRHAMASSSTEQLTLAVMQILKEHLEEEVPQDIAERVVNRIHE